MTGNYYISLKEIWERYHGKEIPETNFDWQTWTKKRTIPRGGT